MSTTTARVTEQREALQLLARDVDRLVPTRMYPGQALKVTVVAYSAQAVREAAERAGHPDDVEVHVTAAGNVMTSVLIGYGTGPHPSPQFPAAMRYAAVLEVVHIAHAPVAVEAVLA